MGPMEISDKIQEVRGRIERTLRSGPESEADYAIAYGSMKELALWAAIETAKLDPSFSPMTYDDIITREA